MFLCVPELSLFEWHPFSISSGETDERLHMHIRVLGDWTRALYRLVAAKVRGNLPTPLRRCIRIRALDCRSGPHRICWLLAASCAPAASAPLQAGSSAVEVGAFLEGPFGSPTIDLLGECPSACRLQHLLPAPCPF
jgi:hypothetical protein